MSEECDEFDKQFEDKLKKCGHNNKDLMKRPVKHPLLNPNSPHYKMVDGREAIELMEMMFSTVELMHWAKITAMKYRLRIGSKDCVSKEALKIKTYEAYYEYLAEKLNSDA